VTERAEADVEAEALVNNFSCVYFLEDGRGRRVYAKRAESCSGVFMAGGGIHASPDTKGRSVVVLDFPAVDKSYHLVSYVATSIATRKYEFSFADVDAFGKSGKKSGGTFTFGDD
jgi:hypothetical protein